MFSTLFGEMPVTVSQDTSATDISNRVPNLQLRQDPDLCTDISETTRRILHSLFEVNYTTNTSNKYATLLVFDSKVRFLPSTDTFSSDFQRDIIRYMYDPEVVDYSVITIDTFNPRVEIITDFRLLNALKQCKFVDHAGYFSTLNGLLTPNLRDISSFDPIEDIRTKVRSTIETVCTMYPSISQTPSRSPPKTLPEGIFVRLGAKTPLKKVKEYSPNVDDDNEKTDDNGKTDNNEPVGMETSILGRESAPYGKPINILNNSNKKYVILKNTQEDTVAYIPQMYYTDHNIREYIHTCFPEFAEIGSLYADSEEDIVNTIRENIDKSADEIWHILQTSASTTLPSTICPSKERIEKTLRSLYTISNERSKSISFQKLLQDIQGTMYVLNDKPTGSVLNRIKRILPIVLQSMGLEKKRMSGGIHWYGMEDKSLTVRTYQPHTSLGILHSSSQKLEDRLNRVEDRLL